MIGQFLWSVLALITVYVVSVFFWPTQADSIAARLGFGALNTELRAIKLRLDGIPDTKLPSLSVPLPSEVFSSGSVGATVKNIVDTAKRGGEVIDTAKTLVNTKVEQIEATRKSFEETQNAIQTLQGNIKSLGDFSLSGQTTLKISTSTTSGKNNTGAIVR